MREIVPVREEQIDRLKVRVFENRSEMGKAAGQEIKDKIRELLSEKEEIRMIFAAAPSQNEVLRSLLEAVDIDWSRISVFHMDEYIGLPEEAPQRFGHFLSECLFNRVNPKQVHLLDGLNSVKNECTRYEQLLKEKPIDIVCLGIGENGHIAFNDPPVADFEDDKLVKKVQLDQECRQQQVNDECFSTIDEVPREALTLTIPALFSGGFLYCVVPGKSKRQAVQRTLNGPIETVCPASVLRKHSHCQLYLDQESYGEL